MTPNIKVVKLPKEVLEKAEMIGNIFTALQRIEDIVSDDFSHDAEFNLVMGRLTEKEKVFAEKLGKIYMIVHALNPNHSCYSVHGDWRKESLN